MTLPPIIFSIVFALFTFQGNNITEASLEQSGTLVVNIENVSKAQGDLRLGIFTNATSYDAENNPEFPKVFAADKTGTVSVQVKDLPFGKYGIALMHDWNSNGEMDFNFVGLPKEPYGFSKKKSRFSKPSFEQVQFEFSADNQSIKIELVEW